MVHNASNPNELGNGSGNGNGDYHKVNIYAPIFSVGGCQLLYIKTTKKKNEGVNIRVQKTWIHF